jgi:AraC-like DNA-binding protein
MGVIATLLPPVQLQRVRTAIRDRHEVVACDDWTSLARTCERQPVRLAIVDLFAEPNASFDRLRRLKQRLPQLAVVAYVAVSPERSRELFDAGRQGVDGLIVFDRDDAPIDLLRCFALAESRSVADIVRRLLRGADSVVYDAVMLAVTRAHERLSPSGLAKLLGVPRRTLAMRLNTAGYASPRRLLTWGRLIVAAQMMEDQGRSAERVAASLDFPSGSAFRNVCQRYLHATPRQMRERGGSQYVIRAFFRQSQAPAQSSRHARSGRRLALAV